MAAGDRGRRGRGTYGDKGQRGRGTSHRGGRSGEGKQSDRESRDKRTKDSPGPIGGHDSYGMDKDTFDHTIGRGNRDRGGDASKPSTSVVDTVTDVVTDAWTSVKNYFSGEEDTTGFSPMGGPSSYGMTKKDFDTTIGERRHRSRSLAERMVREIDYFKEAPMDYAADLIDNPMVNLGLAMSGLGMTAFGVKAVDAVMDAFQGEATLGEAASSIAGNAISSTPIGAALGPARDIAAAAVKDPDAAAGVIGGMLGGRIGGMTGSKVAAAVTDNPYARAALTAGTAAASASYARNWVGEKQREAKQMGTQTAKADTPKDRGGDRESPLASSGERAVARAERLMQPAQADLYARTVEALPFYGLNQQQLPFYGV